MFNVGDLIRVKENVKDNKWISFVEEMERYLGKEYFIKETNADGWDDVYRLESCDYMNERGWLFAEEWLELVEKPKTYHEIKEKELLTLFK